MDLELIGKRAIVTGGASGIGKATAALLSVEGADVVVASRSAQRLGHAGRIINVSGLAARSTGSVVGSIRNVSVAAMTKNLADELGRHGINVTVVHPGLTRTEATPGVVAATASREGIKPAAVERRLAAGNALGRMITAGEVAAVIAFLASPRSVAINGDAVACGGGTPRAIYY